MRKRSPIDTEEREDNAFSLSTGDLMAGLLFIFILLLMGALLQVQEKDYTARSWKYILSITNWTL